MPDHNCRHLTAAPASTGTTSTPSLIAFDTPLQRAGVDEASVTVWSLKPNVILKPRTGPDHNADVSTLPRLHISNSLLLTLTVTPLIRVPLPPARPYSVFFSSVSATTCVSLHLTVPMRCSSLDFKCTTCDTTARRLVPHTCCTAVRRAPRAWSIPG